ncbi:MAG TPA: hypothetical protein VFL61_02760 [Gaiellaceae bacterium]|jgi:hypothetical protein|nr:hypothetical protein [Gaiellaceae bacterium]
MRRKRILLGLVLAGLLILAVVGAVAQLARGERPALLAAGA